MLLGPHGAPIVSTLGWVDRAGLWVLRPGRDAPETIPLGDAKFLSLHKGRNGCFALGHHTQADRFAVTVHAFADPEAVLADAEIDSTGSRLSGDTAAWSSVPTSYVTYWAGPLWRAYALFRVRPRDGDVEPQQLGWYGDEYDKGYQAVIGVTEVPDGELLIFSIQRDSHPVVYDPITQQKVGQLSLADRGGNSTLEFRRRTNELWADDYDTVVKLEPGTWRILGSRLLQGAAGGVTRQFIGQVAFTDDESLATVARPFSRDVIAIDPSDLCTRFRCPLDGQPLEAVALPDRSVVARDWKTGALLRGQLR